jgi:hypothetical protein
MIFTFSNGGKEIQIIVVAYKNSCEIQNFLSIYKFYWDTAMLIHLHAVHVCFHALKDKTEKLRQRLCGLQSLKYLLSGPLHKVC